LLTVCTLALLGASAFALPTEEITRAVAVHGVSDVSLAQPKQFLKAFTAVALRTQPRELPDYVIAAINLRPDLSPKIVAVAIKAAVRNCEGKPATLCVMIDRIVKAAVATQPDSTVSIVKAGAAAWPELRHCIATAAIAAAPHEKDAIVRAATARTLPFAFLTFSATDYTGFSYTAPTLNPANIFDRSDNGGVNSPEQPPQ
jgi:hypothetical protein